MGVRDSLLLHPIMNGSVVVMNASNLVDDAVGDTNWHAGEHEAWKKHFDAETRRQLIEDDRTAWSRVVAVLILIVIGGLGLGVTGVLLSVNF